MSFHKGHEKKKQKLIQKFGRQQCQVTWKYAGNWIRPGVHKMIPNKWENRKRFKVWRYNQYYM